MTEPLLNVKMDVNLPYDTDWESLPDFMKYARQTINDEQNVAKEGDVVTVELYYAYPKDGGEPFIMWSDVNGISTDGEDGWDPYSADHTEAEKAIPGVFRRRVNHVVIGNLNMISSADGVKITLRKETPEEYEEYVSMLADRQDKGELDASSGYVAFLTPLEPSSELAPFFTWPLS